MFSIDIWILGISFDVGGNLIVEKLLRWVLKLLSMFGLNKYYVLEKLWMMICEFIAFHMHHGCVKEKKNLLKFFMKWKKKKKWRWKVKAYERPIKKEVISLVWKTQKLTSVRLWIGSVFGYGCVSFSESPRTIVHYMTVYYILTCILFNC